jgi:hypothetical protein
MARMWRQMAEQRNVTAASLLKNQLALSFQAEPFNMRSTIETRPISWTANGPGTGKFSVIDPAAAVFVGFPQGANVQLGPIALSNIQTPFLAATLVSADGKTPLEQSDRLLLTLAARQTNHDMQWNDARTSVANHWGKGPTQIEVVKANLAVPAGWKLYPLNAEGAAGESLPLTNNTADLSTSQTIWYELRK